MARMHTNPMNAAFLMMESRERPMHVATLLIYSLPPGAGADFVKRIVADLQQSTEFVAPFNLRLRNPALKFALPMWQEDFDLDLEYHVRHSALPYPGGERELGVLISRLHSNPMDLNRPLWEYHVIEGLERNRFAVYFKMHHALVDGLAGLRMLQRSMSTRQEDVNTPALWSAHPPGGGLAGPSAPFNWDLLGSLGGTLRSAGDVANALLAMLQAAYDQKDPVKLPFETPVSILNHRVHSQRRFATQTCEFERIRRLSKHADCTINDVVLALCSGALRRFLKDRGELPGRSLTAGIPVSIRPPGDEGSLPAVSFIIADLATNVANAERRLAVITASTRRAKTLLQKLPRDSLEKWSAAVMLPYTVQILAGLEGRTRPVFNLTISNVPGPREYLYFRGARLEGLYPVSLVTHGQALNITCYSYVDTLTFGFVGCRDTLPRMQRLAVYTGEALDELEQTLLGKAARDDIQPAREAVKPRASKTGRRRRSAASTADAGT
jgi:diacylglycerol O-acyltransferase